MLQPVFDPEKARCEQDENALRVHRKFDNPHALLQKDLNKKGINVHGDKDREGLVAQGGGRGMVFFFK